MEPLELLRQQPSELIASESVRLADPDKGIPGLTKLLCQNICVCMAMSFCALSGPQFFICKILFCPGTPPPGSYIMTGS